MCGTNPVFNMTIKSSDSNVFKEGDANVSLIDLITVWSITPSS